MKPFTIITPFCTRPFFEKLLFSLAGSDWVEGITIIHQEQVHLNIDKCRTMAAGPLMSCETLSRMMAGIKTPHVLFLPEIKQISLEPEAFEKTLRAFESTHAGIVYSDYDEEDKNGNLYHPLNDYQTGSVRDDFDFGAMFFFSTAAIHKVLEKYGLVSGIQSAGLYDLRLKISIDHPVHHLQRALYSLIKTDELSNTDTLFSYVDPRNRVVQKEMETVFTDYLKKIGAYLPPRTEAIEKTLESFPVEASVIIPVRNRKETIAEAARSALSQKTDFPYNVIVVDNHSQDGTTSVLADLATKHFTLKHIIPKRTDLGIGGCWNEGIWHEACGRYAVQLDSDDLYRESSALQRMVDKLREGPFGMVIGSYTLVDSNLEEIPPGLIDHREWTDENGHNNVLRINGLGAPRGFNTALMRRIGFLNVSYGEDYAAALNLCRQYRIGRIYESLYFCRRWSGNTDAALRIEEVNRNNAFKDKIRSDEIHARQKMNQQR